MLQTPSKTTQTLLSPRIPRDNEHERYHPELEEELKAIYAEMPKECVASVGLMRRVPSTQSIGVAGTREVRCKNWDALYDLCEKRLAAAQTAGGDRIYDGE